MLKKYLHKDERMVLYIAILLFFSLYVVKASVKEWNPNKWDVENTCNCFYNYTPYIH